MNFAYHQIVTSCDFFGKIFENFQLKTNCIIVNWKIIRGEFFKSLGFLQILS